LAQAAGLRPGAPPKAGGSLGPWPRGRPMSDGFGASILASFRKCLGQFLRLSAPTPCVEVTRLLVELQFTPRQINYLYETFQNLKRFDSLTLTTGENEVSVQSTFRVVQSKREWVEKIMKLLLDLAGFNEAVSWDGFVFVFLQFCTLSKVELCQVLFFIISKHMKSWTVQYLTSTQLEEFYEDYKNCPVPSFDTGMIEFSKLPLAKYSMSDFIQLMFRFSQLINPCLHLQRQLQRAFPSAKFWADYDKIVVSNRKIAIDFFRHKKVSSILDAIGLASQSSEAEELLSTQRYVLESKNRDHRTKDEVREDMMKVLGEIKRVQAALGRGDTPLPYAVLGLPMPHREKREHEEILPAWLQEYADANAELLGVRKVEQKAAAMAAREAQRLAVANSGLKSLEDVRESMQRTYGTVAAATRKTQLSKAFEHTMAKRSEGERRVELKRHMELDFIRRNRRGEARRDSIVDIIGRCRPCELIDRQVHKVQGHL